MTTITEKSTLSEYFEQEIQWQTRHEYIDGKIVAITGETPLHNRIITNLLVALHIALRDQFYAVFVTDQRLWIPERRIATYPDIMVMSEPFSYQEGRKDTLINPTFIERYNYVPKYRIYLTENRLLYVDILSCILLISRLL